jgi:hypothetical protein
MIFKGKVTSKSVKAQLLATINNRPGECRQSLAINLKTKRLFFVSDDAIYSIPLNKLNAGTLTMDDFHYTVFNSKREFEGLSFDASGKAYLLLMRGSEVLTSNYIYY